ncbi:hypothetical protein [Escherichia coli]|uniref:hypothetical protein n=1 Tax=Escherichia coli TaxID=562 RepID=UPI00313C5F3B
MITVIISEVDGWREWKHRARTKDAQTAIIRAMNKHFPRSYNLALLQIVGGDKLIIPFC